MMEDLKIIGKFCVLAFMFGVTLIAGNRTMEFVWPRQETVRIVHYLCAEDDDGDVLCGRIKDMNIIKEVSKTR